MGIINFNGEAVFLYLSTPRPMQGLGLSFSVVILSATRQPRQHRIVAKRMPLSDQIRRTGCVRNDSIRKESLIQLERDAILPE